jgi:dephospho-CoA kinase
VGQARGLRGAPSPGVGVDQAQLRATLIENAAEINRLHRRIHETVKRRSESEALRQEWLEACQEFHARYAELCIPGGLHPAFYERLLAGDPATIEGALCFLEVRPYFFRSGYHWKTILQKCKRAPMSAEQSERFARLVERYTEWKRLRSLSSQRGAAVRRDLHPLLLRFYEFFPVKLSDGKLDALVTVGDLYNALCTALKLEPHRQPENQKGVAREPQRASPQVDASLQAREYIAWRHYAWTPEDVWATLVSPIVEVYQLDASFVIAPETILRQPSGD